MAFSEASSTYLDRPGVIENLLNSLALKTEAAYVHNFILTLIYDHAYFSRIAEWFIKNNGTQKTANLKRLVTNDPTLAKEKWAEMLKAKKKTFFNALPLKTNAEDKTPYTLAKHPFEKLLGHYCERQLKFSEGKLPCGSYNIGQYLKAVIDTYESGNITLANTYLNDTFTLIKASRADLPVLLSLEKTTDTLTKHMPEIKRAELLNAERIAALCSTGKSASIHIIDHMLTHQLTKMDNQAADSMQIPSADIANVIALGNLALQLTTSSHSHFIMSSIYYHLATCAAFFDDGINPEKLHVPLTFNCSVAEMKSCKVKKPAYIETQMQKNRNLCFCLALYYMTIADILNNSSDTPLKTISGLYISRYGNTLREARNLMEERVCLFSTKVIAKNVIFSATQTVATSDPQSSLTS